MLKKITFKQIVEGPIGPLVLFGAIMILPLIQTYFAIKEFLSDA